jgi:hypothetical protein
MQSEIGLSIKFEEIEYEIVLHLSLYVKPFQIIKKKIHQFDYYVFKI